jgi:hypothetical protein
VGLFVLRLGPLGRGPRHRRSDRGDGSGPSAAGDPRLDPGASCVSD